MSINRDINETWIDGAFESTKHNLLQEVDRWNPNEPKRESRFLLWCIPPEPSNL